MSSEGSEGSGAAKPKTTGHRSLDLAVSVSRETVKGLMEELSRVTLAVTRNAPFDCPPQSHRRPDERHFQHRTPPEAPLRSPGLTAICR